MSESQELTTLEPTLITQQQEIENIGPSKPLGNPAWRPGISGNPGGRPKIDYSAKIARLVLEKEPEKLEAALSRCLYMGLKKGDIKAFKVIAERAFGKLPQPVEHGGTDGGPIEIVIAAAPKWIK